MLFVPFDCVLQPPALEPCGRANESGEEGEALEVRGGYKQEAMAPEEEETAQMFDFDNFEAAQEKILSLVSWRNSTASSTIQSLGRG